ncbi:MAG: hypothetical protein Q8L93_06385 [Rhodocyclaceae bacterium]|nr:hypothetical protein [Rhodocyclaceae bacterium]
MSREDDVITQADALMRRHRSFVARVVEVANEETAAAAAHDAENDTEIPVLTEVVDASETAPRDIEAVLAALRADVENELSAWLVEVLPAAVANASQNILTELDAKARHTLLPHLLEILKNGTTRQKL